MHWLIFFSFMTLDASVAQAEHDYDPVVANLARSLASLDHCRSFDQSFAPPSRLGNEVQDVLRRTGANEAELRRLEILFHLSYLEELEQFTTLSAKDGGAFCRQIADQQVTARKVFLDRAVTDALGCRC